MEKTRIVLNSKQFAEYVKTYMEITGSTMTKLAGELGVNKATVSRIVAGRSPDVHTFLAMVVVMNIKDISRFCKVEHK